MPNKAPVRHAGPPSPEAAPLFPDLDEAWFRAILQQLIDRNALACRAVLTLARVRFTTQVPTLAVTLAHPVELLVNLDFVRKHCATEAHVEALLLHEFLHVLLGHTERFERMNPALNVALDAVINAIIHRSVGPEHSDMMARYYADEKGFGRLLRPITSHERDHFLTVQATLRKGPSPQATEALLGELWRRLYDGRTCADDVLDLMESIGGDPQATGSIRVLGSHDPHDPAEPGGELLRALSETMKQMNGDGIWRSPKDRGVGQYATSLKVETDERLALWERTAWDALRRALLPDRTGVRRGTRETVVPLPVLSPRDRRGFVRALWSPILPENQWPASMPGDRVSALVYLDVSGSMNAEMPALITLLARLRTWISMPFWAFSDNVSPASIENGRLVTETTGGTSMNAVLRHVAAKRPARALVVTDGYIERVDPDLLAACHATKIHALVTRDGSTMNLDAAGIPVTQLEAFPGADPALSQPSTTGSAASNPRPGVVRR